VKAYLKQQISWFSSQPGMDEPLVRWGLLAIAMICFWSFLLLPYVDWHESRQNSIHLQSNKAAKILAFKASSKMWKESSEEHYKAVKLLTDALFQDSSYAAAQAALLKKVVGLMGSHHLILDSQRLLDADIEEGFGQRVAVVLRVRGEQADVMNFIDAIATSDKLIILDKMYMNREHGSSMLLQFQATSFRLMGEDS